MNSDTVGIADTTRQDCGVRPSKAAEKIDSIMIDD